MNRSRSSPHSSPAWGLVRSLSCRLSVWARRVLPFSLVVVLLEPKLVAQTEPNPPAIDDPPLLLVELEADQVATVEQKLGPLRPFPISTARGLLERWSWLLSPARCDRVQFEVEGIEQGVVRGTTQASFWLENDVGCIVVPIAPGGCLHDSRLDGTAAVPKAVTPRWALFQVSGRGRHHLQFSWHLVGRVVHNHCRFSWPWPGMDSTWRLPAKLRPVGRGKAVINRQGEHWVVGLPPGNRSLLVELNGEQVTPARPTFFGVLRETIRYASPRNGRFELRLELHRLKTGAAADGLLLLRPNEALLVEGADGGPLPVHLSSDGSIELLMPEQLSQAVVTLTGTVKADTSLALPLFRLDGPVQCVRQCDLVLPEWLVPLIRGTVPADVLLERPAAPSNAWRFTWSRSGANGPVRLELAPAQTKTEVEIVGTLVVDPTPRYDAVVTVRPSSRLASLTIRAPQDWTLAAAHSASDNKPMPFRRLGTEGSIRWLVGFERPLVPGSPTSISLRFQPLAASPERLSAPCVQVDGAVLVNGRMKVVADEGQRIQLGPSQGVEITSADTTSNGVTLLYGPFASGILRIGRPTPQAHARMSVDVTVTRQQTSVSTLIEFAPATTGEIVLEWPHAKDVPGLYATSPHVLVKRSGRRILIRSTPVTTSEEAPAEPAGTVQVELLRRYPLENELDVWLPTVVNDVAVTPTVTLTRADAGLSVEPVGLVPAPREPGEQRLPEAGQYRYAAAHPAFHIRRARGADQPVAFSSVAAVTYLLDDAAVTRLTYFLDAIEPSTVELALPGNVSTEDVLYCDPPAESGQGRLRVPLKPGRNRISLAIRTARIASGTRAFRLIRPDVYSKSNRLHAHDLHLNCLSVPAGRIALLRQKGWRVLEPGLDRLGWSERVLLAARLLVWTAVPRSSIEPSLARSRIRAASLKDCFLLLDELTPRTVLLDQYALALAGISPEQAVDTGEEGKSVQELLKEIGLAAYISRNALLITTENETFPLLGFSVHASDSTFRHLRNPALGAACEEAIRRGVDSSERFARLDQWLVYGKQMAEMLSGHRPILGRLVVLDSAGTHARRAQLYLVPAGLLRRSLIALGCLLALIGIVVGRRCYSLFRRFVTTSVLVAGLLAVQWLPPAAAVIAGWAVLCCGLGVVAGMGLRKKRPPEESKWAVASTVTVARGSSRASIGVLLACLAIPAAARAQDRPLPVVLFRTPDRPDVVLVPERTITALEQLDESSKVVTPHATLRVELNDRLWKATARFEIVVGDGEPASIGLPLATWSYLSLALDGTAPELRTNNGQATIICPPGAHTLEIVATKLAARAPTGTGMQIELPWIPVLETELELHAPKGVFFVQPPLCVEPTEPGGPSIRGHVGPTDRLQITWLEEPAFASRPGEGLCDELVLAGGQTCYRVLKITPRSNQEPFESWRFEAPNGWRLLGSNVPVMATPSEIVVMPALAEVPQPTVYLLFGLVEADGSVRIAPLQTAAGLLLRWRNLVLAQLPSLPPLSIEKTTGLRKTEGPADPVADWLTSKSDGEPTTKFEVQASWRADSNEFELLLVPSPAEAAQGRITVSSTLDLTRTRPRLEHVVRLEPNPRHGVARPLVFRSSANWEPVAVGVAPGWTWVRTSDRKQIVLLPPKSRRSNGDSTDAAKPSSSTLLRMTVELPPNRSGRYGVSDLLLAADLPIASYEFNVRHGPDWLVEIGADGWTKKATPPAAEGVDNSVQEIRLRTRVSPLPGLTVLVRPRLTVQEWQATTTLESYERRLNGRTHFLVRGAFPAGQPLTVHMPRGATIRHVGQASVVLRIAKRRAGDRDSGAYLELVPDSTVAGTLEFEVSWQGRPTGLTPTRWRFQQPRVQGQPPRVHRIHIPRTLLPPGAEIHATPEQCRVETGETEITVTVEGLAEEADAVTIDVALASWAQPRLVWLERVTLDHPDTDRFTDQWMIWLWAPFGGYVTLGLDTEVGYTAFVDGSAVATEASDQGTVLYLDPNWALRRLDLVSTRLLSRSEVMQTKLAGVQIGTTIFEPRYVWLSTAPIAGTKANRGLSPGDVRALRGEKMRELAMEIRDALLRQKRRALIVPYVQLCIGEALARAGAGNQRKAGKIGVLAQVLGLAQELPSELGTDLREAVRDLLGEDRNWELFRPVLDPRAAAAIVGVGLAPQAERTAQKPSVYAELPFRQLRTWIWPAVAMSVVLLVFLFERYLLFRLGLGLLGTGVAAYLLEENPLVAAGLFVLALPPLFLGLITVFVHYLQARQEQEIIEA